MEINNWFLYLQEVVRRISSSHVSHWFHYSKDGVRLRTIEEQEMAEQLCIKPVFSGIKPATIRAVLQVAGKSTSLESLIRLIFYNWPT